MTKPVTRKMAVDCLLYWFGQGDSRGIITTVIKDGGGLVLLCPECGEPILPGQQIQFDHRHAIIHRGPHEYQNLRPVHYDPCHKKKSARDVAAKAKGDRILGLTKTKPKAKIAGRGFRKDLTRGFNGKVRERPLTMSKREKV